MRKRYLAFLIFCIQQMQTEAKTLTEIVPDTKALTQKVTDILQSNEIPEAQRALHRDVYKRAGDVLFGNAPLIKRAKIKTGKNLKISPELQHKLARMATDATLKALVDPNNKEISERNILYYLWGVEQFALFARTTFKDKPEVLALLFMILLSNIDLSHCSDEQLTQLMLKRNFLRRIIVNLLDYGKTEQENKKELIARQKQNTAEIKKMFQVLLNQKSGFPLEKTPSLTSMPFATKILESVTGENFKNLPQNIQTLLTQKKKLEAKQAVQAFETLKKHASASKFPRTKDQLYENFKYNVVVEKLPTFLEKAKGQEAKFLLEFIEKTEPQAYFFEKLELESPVFKLFGIVFPEDAKKEQGSLDTITNLYKLQKMTRMPNPQYQLVIKLKDAYKKRMDLPKEEKKEEKPKTPEKPITEALYNLAQALKTLGTQ